MPCSLVELIESRIGALPTAVGAVIDALAVGEPIELAALRRITDPDAVEEADSRGLIILDHIDSGIEVRVAHPLYGEVRRKRAAPTRLMRLRGLVATELGAGGDRDDIRVVVRRATLSLDSDLTPDTDLLIKAAQGAIWLADLSLADRLAEAAVRAGAGPEAQFHTRACVVVAQPRPRSRSGARRRSDHAIDRQGPRQIHLSAGEQHALGARRLRRGRKRSSTTRRISQRARLATGSTPSARCTGLRWTGRMRRRWLSKNLALDDLPAIVGTETAWAIAAISADAGRATEAVAIADAGYTVATRCFDAPHMRFNIADAHVSALLLSGRVSDALEVAERVRQQAADLPGQLNHSVLPSRVGPHSVPAASIPHVCCWKRQQQRCPPRAMPSAGGTAITSHARSRSPCAVALTRLRAALGALDTLRRPFRSLDYERSVARAWVAASQGAISEAITILLSAAKKASANGQFAAEVICLQTATQFGDRTSAPRLRELEAIVEGPRVGFAARFAAALHDGDAAELSAVSEDFEAMGDPGGGGRCVRTSGHGVSPSGSAWIGLGMCDPSRSAGRAMRRRRYPRASSGERALAADRSGTRDRDAAPPGSVQPRHRRAPDCFGSDGRRPHLQGDEQDRYGQPRGARSAAARTQAADPH